jgi:hypothetical protein
MDLEGNNSYSYCQTESGHRTGPNVPYRIYSEGVSCNKKVYSESETQARVLQATKHFGDRLKFYYDRIPEERIDEFAYTRRVDEDRSQKRVNKLFPELNAAREAYLGPEPSVA